VNDVWRRVLQLAWEGYRHGCLPIGAAVTDPAGIVVAEARNQLQAGAGRPGQLANSRVAHAEVNALAQLPSEGSAHYAGYSLTTNVEPCCMCMGAVIQSGIGTLWFSWADAHAGATACMTVDNPQVRRRRLQVIGPRDPFIERLTGLLIFCHYLYVRPGIDHVVSAFAIAEPDLHALARTLAVAEIVVEASRSGESLDGLLACLGPYLAVRASRCRDSGG
jgi:tRNA(Arg) A34 adenosine deaminase TadA